MTGNLRRGATLIAGVALACVAVLGPASGLAVAGDGPTVTITAPPNYTFASTSTIVSADVEGGAGPYTGVELLVNGTVTGAAQSGAEGTYSFTWSTASLSDGAYALTVQATDSTGTVGTSAGVSSTVDRTPPTTTITEPSGQSYAQGSLAVEAKASDAYGVAQVQFLIDGTPSGAPVTQPTNAPAFRYATSLELTGLSLGTHTLTEVTTDNAGNTTTSAPEQFTDGSGPAVALTAPADSSFATKTTTVTATVSGAPSAALAMMPAFSPAIPAMSSPRYST